jgi:F-type H+-transporting ATPase subunit epsilon
MSIILIITIPSEVVYKKTVSEVILPTITGQMGILYNHLPTIIALDIGILRIKETSSENWTPMLISNGFAQVENNIVQLVIAEYEQILKENYANDLKELELATQQLNNMTNQKEKFNASKNLKRIIMKLEGHKFLK